MRGSTHPWLFSEKRTYLPERHNKLFYNIDFSSLLHYNISCGYVIHHNRKTMPPVIYTAVKKGTSMLVGHDFTQPHQLDYQSKL